MKIVEHFGPTIQGEGKSAGKIVNFLRLAGCNLNCEWCDSKYASHPETFEEKTVDELFEIFSQAKVKRLVITGGEPLLQQDELVLLIRKLKESDKWYIEMETNCTIVPNSELSMLVDQFNVSPKLANSKNNLLVSINEEAINFFASFENSCFKFVTDNNIDEIKQFVTNYKIPADKVYLMAEGFERFAQVEQVEKILNWCVENGFNYGPRLHTLLWGNRRGV